MAWSGGCWSKFRISRKNYISFLFEYKVKTNAKAKRSKGWERSKWNEQFYWSPVLNYNWLVQLFKSFILQTFYLEMTDIYLMTGNRITNLYGETNSTILFNLEKTEQQKISRSPVSNGMKLCQHDTSFFFY